MKDTNTNQIQEKSRRQHYVVVSRDANGGYNISNALAHDVKEAVVGTVDSLADNGFPIIGLTVLAVYKGRIKFDNLLEEEFTITLSPEEPEEEEAVRV